MTTGITAAFENFMSDRKDMEKAILCSTRASWGGSGYSLELFEDGTYRVLWDDNIGNLYTSPGIIIPIPPLARDQYVYTENEEEGNREDTGAIYYPFFDNAEDDLRMIFQDYLDQERWDNK